MTLLDAFFRFSGLGILLLLIFLTIRDLKRSSSAVYLLLACISISCHFLGFTPKIFELPISLEVPFRLLDVFMVAMIWLFILSLFQKDFKFGYLHLLVIALYSVPILLERFVSFGYLSSLPKWWAYIVNGFTFALVLHIIYVSFKGKSDDLIESRRKTRRYLLVMSILSTLSAIVFGSILLHKYQATVNVLSIWPSIIGLALWLLSIEPSKFNFYSKLKADSINLNSKDKILKQKLDTEIIENKCYLESSLTIESLAKRLGVSAYRLREFINQKLGYTNFSSYINQFRVESIKLALANPDNAHIPVLTLALDHGFNSLSPFNRAFKATEGMTPTQFRQKTLKTP